MGFWEDTTTFAKTDAPRGRATGSADDIVLRVFDPLTQVTADAKYIVRMLVLWFLVVPVVLGGIVFLITR